MIELRDISFRVQEEKDGEERWILKGINLKIDKDSFVAITGPNGSGKSTLAKIIVGIETPTTGQILLNGEDITELSISERAKRGIGFAFQQPIRFKGLLIRDLLRFAAGRDLSTEQACSYLARVGLCALDYVDRELNDSLSGGEMKRVEIAMLMARNVQLSVLDEPEAGIDLWSFHNLIKTFGELRERTQGSLLVISHQERILEIADRIILLEEGQVADEGNPVKMLPKLLDNIDICNYYRKEA
ncbi:MAG: ATP-binding cassette domain-containing protein [Tissierellia bacterium]|nr:ATP-binding cassette domain-containing protein [Tissierellia bacterium]